MGGFKNTVEPRQSCVSGVMNRLSSGNRGQSPVRDPLPVSASVSRRVAGRERLGQLGSLINVFTSESCGTTM